MQGSLLLKIISSLEQEERVRFSSFIRTPYFNNSNQSEELIQLWILVESRLNETDKSCLLKKNIYTSLFPNQPFYRGKLEKLMSQLVQLLNQFFITEKKIQDPKSVFYQLELYKQYSDRGLETEAKVKINALLKQQQDLKTTAQNLYNRFLTDQSITQQESLKKNRRDYTSLLKVMERLDHYYIFTRLEYSFQILAINQWISPLDYYDLLDRMDLNLRQLSPKLEEDSVFSLYLMAYQLLRNFQQDGTTLFKTFLNAFEQKSEFCTKEQVKAFQAFSRNVCIYFYHQGKDEFIQLTYQLYRKHLKAGLLYHGEKIMVGSFYNLVILGIRNKDYVWVREFIEGHRKKISGSDKAHFIYQFSLAILEFYLQNYDKALDLLLVNFEDQYLKLAARRLEIMVYYELQSPIFIAKLEAYKIYVYRLAKEQNLQKSKDQNRNFVDLLKQIQHPKTFGNPTRIQKILNKIETTKNLAEKPWLKEKLLALQNKK
jgi:hypothetical protein